MILFPSVDGIPFSKCQESSSVLFRDNRTVCRIEARFGDHCNLNIQTFTIERQLVKLGYCQFRELSVCAIRQWTIAFMKIKMPI